MRAASGGDVMARRIAGAFRARMLWHSEITCNFVSATAGLEQPISLPWNCPERSPQRGQAPFGATVASAWLDARRGAPLASTADVRHCESGCGETRCDGLLRLKQHSMRHWIVWTVGSLWGALNERSRFANAHSMQQRMESRKRTQWGRFFGPSPNGGLKNCPIVVLAFLGAGPWLRGCSALPEYATPKAGVVEPGALSGTDLIGYRALTRADFMASAPPASAARHAEQLGALTCTFIVTTPDTSYQIEERRDPDGTSTFTGRFDRLGFVAHMDRNCSWWNPKNDSESEPYVLQHEQIHFALSEIHARRQSIAARTTMSEFRVSSSSLDDAKQQISEELTRLVDEAMEELLDENHEFDEQTSAVRDERVQSEWFEKVNQQLRELDGS